MIQGVHNFLNVQLVRKGKFKLHSGSALKVQVANGQQLKCLGKCLKITFQLAGYSINSDFFALQLEDFDVLLGVQWLKTLGPIVWNYDSLTMSFTKDLKSITLQGQLIQNQLCGKKQFSHS